MRHIEKECHMWYEREKEGWGWRGELAGGGGDRRGAGMANRTVA